MTLCDRCARFVIGPKCGRLRCIRKRCLHIYKCKWQVPIAENCLERIREMITLDELLNKVAYEGVLKDYISVFGVQSKRE